MYIIYIYIFQNTHMVDQSTTSWYFSCSGITAQAFLLATQDGLSDQVIWVTSVVYRILALVHFDMNLYGCSQKYGCLPPNHPLNNRVFMGFPLFSPSILGTIISGNTHIWLHHQKLTWNVEMMVSNRNPRFQGSIFRFHVCFGGCIWNIELKCHFTCWKLCAKNDVASINICIMLHIFITDLSLLPNSGAICFFFHVPFSTRNFHSYVLYHKTRELPWCGVIHHPGTMNLSLETIM